jgi:hypothetical protein
MTRRRPALIVMRADVVASFAGIALAGWLILCSYRLTRSISKSQNVCLAVGVLSGSSNRDRRDAIRSTWKTYAEVCRFKFFMGRPAHSVIVEHVSSRIIVIKTMVTLVPLKANSVSLIGI